MTCTAERRCHSLRCGSCFALRLGDWRASYRLNLGSIDGSAVMATLTAPGDDVLPRDEHGRCLERPLEEWSSTRDERWRRLRNAAQIAARRRAGVRAHLLAPTWEPQRRGAPHLHVPLDTSTPQLTIAAQVFVNYLHDNHARYGFGFADSWSRLKRFSHPLQAAAYLSSYLTAATPGRQKSMAANFRSPHTPRRPMAISRRLTMRTGVTQRNLRRHRQVHVWRSGAAPVPLWWGDVDRGFPGYLRALPLLTPLADSARAP